MATRTLQLHVCLGCATCAAFLSGRADGDQTVTGRHRGGAGGGEDPALLHPFIHSLTPQRFTERLP